jgi:hypothetical protein
MGLLKGAKALGAELEAAVGADGNGEPSGQLVARSLGHAMVCLAVIADALERAHPAPRVKEGGGDATG